MRIWVATFCAGFLAAGSALAADLDRAAVADAGYGYSAHARIEPFCVDGQKSGTLVLRCAPRKILPQDPSTYALQESYLELGRRYRKPYRQLFEW